MFNKINNDYVNNMTKREMIDAVVEERPAIPLLTTDRYYVNGVRVSFKDALTVKTTQIQEIPTPIYSMLSKNI